MRVKPTHHAMATLLLVILAALALASQAQASFFIESGVHIAFHNQADLITGSDMTFNVDTITYGNGSVNIGDRWLNSTCDMTLTAYFEDDWFNYTVSSSGIQYIFNGTKPHSVWINGVNTTEHGGWTYLAGTVTVITTAASVSIDYETSPTIASKDEDYRFTWPDWGSIIPNFGLTIATAYNMLAFLPIIGAVSFLLVMFYYRRLPGFLTIIELLVGMLILSITMYSLLPFIVEWFKALGI